MTSNCNNKEHNEPFASETLEETLTDEPKNSQRKVVNINHENI